MQILNDLAARREALAWYAQRLSAMVLAILVLIHLAVMIYAVRGGLSGSEIRGRLRGSVGWLAVYGLLVTASAVHAPIGLRAIGREWLGLSARSATLLAWAFALLLLVLGWRAVLGLVFGGH